MPWYHAGMDMKSAEALRKLNVRFYREHASSFSATRNAPWPGWERCARAVAPALEAGRARVFDLACGNLRFERFLRERFANTRFEFHAADAIQPAGDAVSGVFFHRVDALREPLPELSWCDLSVCFGFLHHVAIPKQRARILDRLVACTRPGGYVAVSLWQFLNDEKLAERACATTRAALRDLGPLGLGEGDFILGWQGKEGAWRYCHSFSADEVDALAAHVSPKAKVAARFSSDGRTGDLNAYLVLQVA